MISSDRKLTYYFMKSLLTLHKYLPGCTPQSSAEMFGINNIQTLAAPDCVCSNDKYVPMCGHNFTFEDEFYEEMTILTPCQAGCTGVVKDGNARNYTGCAENVTRGICAPQDCHWKLKVYLSVVW